MQAQYRQLMTYVWKVLCSCLDHHNVYPLTYLRRQFRLKLSGWMPLGQIYHTTVATLAHFPSQDIPPNGICGERKTPPNTDNSFWATPTRQLLAEQLSPGQLTPRTTPATKNSRPIYSHPNIFNFRAIDDSLLENSLLRQLPSRTLPQEGCPAENCSAGSSDLKSSI